MHIHRLREKGNLEATFFNIQARLKANGQKEYKPPEGFYIHDIESAWIRLEKSEHGREVALRDELIRQERLEQLAQGFRRKVRKYRSPHIPKHFHLSFYMSLKNEIPWINCGING